MEQLSEVLSNHLSDQTSEVTFARLLSDEHPMYCLLIEHEGVPAGMVHFIMHRSTWTTGDYCYLQDLYVVETSRGNGIGKALILAVYEKAQNAGCSRVYWTTQEKNERARKVYDRIASKTDFIQYRHLIN
ncbi:GNAT family N-acetyltransferase [Rouxiella badensis]|uniref:GNAT family N-acetyltransferase n=1 Tax=Rouxiella badensis TaxID=1646377 RepID=UPI001D150163|nr:GNAT family N-acetyltransferase [Rouxiella badensis]MCC3731992.1 GNAT family N-acetyltransferase [Rouxiella badensis]MCC3757381.1 GNAT family N-acetyltransferase [Rouxiella badensis]